MRNNRCGILEVAPWLGSMWHLVPYIAYQQFICPITGISISVMETIHVMGIQDYSCNNNPCDMNSGQCNRNTKVIITYA